MKVFHWPGEAPPVLPHSVATLGVFDGVHLGHRRILERVLEAEQRLGAPSVVITLDRHPQRAVEGRAEPVITSLEHRLRLFEELGLGYCMVIRFAREVAQMEAADFARTVFRDLLHVRLLVVGFDCRFGRGREGDVALCRKMAGELGMDAMVVHPVAVNGEVVSSTAIRRAIRRADLPRAARLMGRPFSLFGTVVCGAARGRKIGFPTANLDVHNELLPREGVYVSRIFVEGTHRPSVTSVGTQETFREVARSDVVVEVHVLDADLGLHGRDVEVQFVEWLREQRRFPSAQALSEQIAADVAEARRVLA